MGANGNDNELPAFEPPHPGEYLRKDVMPSLKMTITDLADHLGVTRASLSEFDQLQARSVIGNGPAIGEGIPQRHAVLVYAPDSARYLARREAQQDIRAPAEA